MNQHMAGSQRASRVPAALGSIPVVGGWAKQADSQARWVQELLEQNARLLGQLPATLKAFNDALERFNQTVGRLDRMIDRVDSVTAGLLGPIEQLTSRLDRARDVPELLDVLRREAIPALQAATASQQQIDALAAVLDRIANALGEFPGAAFVRRFTGTADLRRPRQAEDRPGRPDGSAG
jgi:ABC-type transporter Mla subunit MlaD